ncbi:MAG: carboxyl-terminal protease [Chloroflexi bacterium]|nr:carboxyl-terminal protease [Chloroflexota bacterium]
MLKLRAAIPVVLLLLAAAVLQPATLSASTCTDDEADSVSLVQDAVDFLRRLYVEPLTPEMLLVPASAALEEVEERESGVGDPLAEDAFEGEPDEAWAVFADQYCTVLQERVVTGAPLDYVVIRAMANAVDEAHTRFLTPEMYREHQAWAAGESRYEGIGTRLRADPLTVQYVFPGSPAEAAGLQAGDEIVAIDGVPSSGLSAQEAVRLVRGEANSLVRLTIVRAGVTETSQYDIIRASIHIPQVESRTIDDVGYLLLRGFPSASLYDDVRSEVESFESLGLNGLVLDLRGNTGGRLDVGAQVASLFLPEGSPLYQEKTRRGRASIPMTSGDPTWTRPLVVLVDDATASMGEILAAALQEDLGIPLFGTSTAGAVAGSIIVPLRDGSALQVTTLRIDSPTGRLLNGIGVSPDVEFSADAGLMGSGPDEVLDAALEYLRSAAQNNAAAPVAPARGELPSPDR